MRWVYSRLNRRTDATSRSSALAMVDRVNQLVDRVNYRRAAATLASERARDRRTAAHAVGAEAVDPRRRADREREQAAAGGGELVVGEDAHGLAREREGLRRRAVFR